MSMSGLTLLSQIEKKVDWLAARSQILSKNVANADTPGYRTQDLKPFSLTRTLQGAPALALASTSSGHITDSPRVSQVPVLDDNLPITETSPDGNQVSIEDQMTKVADTGMEYQTMTNLYRKQLSMLKTAIGRGGASA